MNKGILGFIGGIVTGVLLTLAAASMIPEDSVIQDLLALKIYDRSDEELDRIQATLCSDDLNLLKKELNQLK